MNSLTHLIKQHASLPDLELQLLDPHEQPVDLTGTSLTFRAQLIGDPSTVMTGAVTITDENLGKISYSFTASNTQISGTYLATIQAAFPGGKIQSFPFNDYYLIQVEPDLAEDSDDPVLDLVFATVADARSMGYEVSAEQLLRAQGIIEVNCGRMIEAIQDAIVYDNISRTDLARLKKATVYQAVWLLANQDVEERMDVTQVRTAGLSGESATLNPDGVILSPLARKLLVGLSWARSRSVRTQSGRGNGTGISLTTVDGSGWRRI